MRFPENPVTFHDGALKNYRLSHEYTNIYRIRESVAALKSALSNFNQQT